MHFLRYTHEGSRPQWGLADDGEVHALADLPAGEPSYADLTNPSYRQAVRARASTGGLSTVPEADVRHLSPVPEPGKIVCVGLNYRDHAEEQDEEIPERPLLFGKAPTAVTNPGDPIYHPDGIEQVDYEVELGVVMGRTARNVSAEAADEYIAGYTAVNDVSARDAQFEDGQYLRGKSYDTFAPTGPRLVAGDDYDPNSVDVACRVNGETKQDSNTDQFIFDVHECVEYISHAMTLRPGDVISTGTPGGVGVFMDPPELLEPGDEVEVEIEGIGTLENHVVDEP